MLPTVTTTEFKFSPTIKISFVVFILLIVVCTGWISQLSCILVSKVNSSICKNCGSICKNCETVNAKFNAYYRYESSNVLPRSNVNDFLLIFMKFCVHGTFNTPCHSIYLSAIKAHIIINFQGFSKLSAHHLTTHG